MRLLVLLLLLAAAAASAAATTLSARMVHRLSDEARLSAKARGGWWPQRGSGEYNRALVRSDLQRKKRRVGAKYQLLSLSEGGGTFSLGNDFGWCSVIYRASIMQDRDLGIYKPLNQHRVGICPAAMSFAYWVQAVQTQSSLAHTLLTTFQKIQPALVC